MKITKLLAILACTGLAFSAFAQDYDLVILNGRVMDPETTFDAVANVGIKDGRITAIPKDKISGKETNNTKGHVVARASSIPTSTGKRRWATRSACAMA